MENNENNKVFTEKIIKTIEKYKDDTTSTIVRIIGKHCNRESINNVKKRREIRRKITLNLLENENIITKIQTEQRICLILDNPLEQIWRQIKREIKHYYLESREFLQELTIKTYNKSISGTKVYDNGSKHL